MKRHLLLLLVISSISSVASASWFSEITGVDINLNAGTVEVKAPNPAAIPEMLRNLPQDVGQALLNPTGSQLAAAIRYSAAQARFGAHPIPPDIKRSLATYIATDILDKAVWTIFDPQRISLDSFIMKNHLANVSAVTLDNVIVFRHSFYATTEGLPLWAHELVHVMQYSNMGVEAFANLYSYNSQELENPAYEMQHRVENDVANGSVSPVRYSFSSVIGTHQLTSQQFTAAAQNYFPPSSCAQVRNVPGGAYVTNVCPIIIWVTGWTQATNWGPIYVNCNFGCGFYSGQTQPVWSSVGGPIINIFFRY